MVKKCHNINCSIKEGTVIVAIDPAYFRPTEVEILIGDSSKAKQKLGWLPKYNLASLIKEMVAADIHLLKNCN